MEIIEKHVGIQMIEAIAVGVVTNFIYSYMKNKVPDTVKRVVPALFFGGSLSLEEIDNIYDDVKRELLYKHRDVQGVQIFLGPEKTISGGVLEPLFDHIFLNKPLNRQRIRANLMQCIGKDKWYQDRNKYTEILDEIIDKFKIGFLGSKSSANFVLNASLEEVKSNINLINNNQEKLFLQLPSYVSKFNNNYEEDVFSRSYLRELKNATKQIFISGVDMITKRQDVRQNIRDTYIPVYLKEFYGKYSDDQYNHSESFDATKLVKNIRRIIVRGPAGCGKTTLMQWIIWNSNPFSIDEVSNSTLPFFPIYIPLRRLEQIGGEQLSLQDVIYNTMPADYLMSKMPVDWVFKLLSKDVELILLIDGLDEVPENRRSAVWDLIRSVAHDYPKVRMLLTSRHISSVHLSDGSYRSDLFQEKDLFFRAVKLWNKPKDFFEFVVSPLNDIEISNLIDSWFSGIDLDNVFFERKEKLGFYPDYLKNEIFQEKHSQILELARTPLLASLICMSFLYSQARLPDTKKEIYEFSVKLMVSFRDKAKKVQDPLPFINFEAEERISLLKLIALNMQDGISSKSSDQTVEVNKNTVLTWIQKWLENYPQLSEGADDYLTFLIDRSSILREPSFNKIDFIHRSFMEYLAAEKIAKERSPYQIRDKIKRDEWTNTLHFCMTTNVGGAYYGASVIKEMYNFIFEDEKIRDARPYLIKICSLTSSFSERHSHLDDTLEEIVPQIIPFQNESEVDECINVPISIFKNRFLYDSVKNKYEDHEIRCVVNFLCRHHDPLSKDIILSGYQNIANIGLIKEINGSGKISVSEHTALYLRIKNGSYTEPVYITASELKDQKLRSSLVKSAWIKFPIVDGNFVGWNYLYRTKNVKFLSASSVDLEIMKSSVTKRKFNSCEVLEIKYGYDIDLSVLSFLFPALMTLYIQMSRGVSLVGLNNLKHLKDLWIEDCSQRIVVDDSMIPDTLESIVFYRSEIPIVTGEKSQNLVHYEVDNLHLGN